VLVGSGKHIEDVAHALINEVHAPVEMVGFISLTPRPDNGLRSLGRIEDLPAVLDAHRVQEVIIADPDFPPERAVDLVDQCHQRGVTVRIAPSTMEILVHRAEFVPGASVPLFELRPPVFDGFDYAIKRSFDFFVSLLLVIVLSPLLALIAIAVAISSRGPVLYRSMRPGIGGEPFACFKFRTMRSDADQLQADLESLNEATGALFKIRRDPRLTRVGRLPAPLLARRAAAAAQRAARADVARRPAAAARSATSSSSRTGTRSATWCCRASPACGRSRAARSSTSTTSCGSTSSISSAGRSGSTWRSCSRRSPRSCRSAARSSPGAELLRLQDLVGGPSRALLLSGEPGIGKTTCWEAGVAAAREAELRVLTAARGGRGEACRSPRLPICSTASSCTGTGVLEVALLREAPEPSAVAAAFLEVLRGLEPVLIAIDDVQWLDPDSAHALAFAARRESFRFLLAARPAPPRR
jgi:hypothetical protein